MTTQAWSTGWGTSTDATFRTVGSEFAAKLAAVGLVQTSDTGQINWTTVVMPVAVGTAAVGNIAGYEIWKFADSLAGSADIYFKIEYTRFTTGSGTGAARVGFYMTVGTGSDGAGTITGQTFPRTKVGSYTSVDGRGDAVALSHMCHTEGSFWFTYKELAFYGGSGSSSVGGGFFKIDRWTDDSGAIVNKGFSVTNFQPDISYGNGAGATSPPRTSVRTVAETGIAIFTSSTTKSYSFYPWALGSTNVNGDKQVGLTYHYTPRFIPNAFECLTATSDAAIYTTFSATVIGATAKTFIPMNSINVGHLTDYAMSYYALIWQ